MLLTLEERTGCHGCSGLWRCCDIGGLEDAARAELFKVFAEMPEAVQPEGYHAARQILKSHEARLLLSADPALRRAA